MGRKTKKKRLSALTIRARSKILKARSRLNHAFDRANDWSRKSNNTKVKFWLNEFDKANTTLKKLGGKAVIGKPYKKVGNVYKFDRKKLKRI